MERYTISSDFSNIFPNIDQLDTEIRESAISTSLVGIQMYADNVDIYFISSISPADKTILDGLVSAHVPVFIPNTDKTIIIHPRRDQYKNNNYKRITSFPFPATTYAKARIISRMHSSITSYDVRIIDKNNHEVLLTTNLNNTVESEEELGILSNLPNSETILEILVKKTGGNGNKVFIETVIIDYVSQ